MKRSIWAVSLACALIAVLPAKATDFTLSDAAILSLDYNLSSSYSPPPTATITSEQDIPGTGVQFNIHFPSTSSLDSFRFQVSDSHHGAGTLVGLNVSAYSNFDLKFTVVSIDGSASVGEEFEVGALITHGSGWAFHPDITSLTGYYPPSVVSTISVTSATFSDIGFYASEFPLAAWSAGPHDVTLLVQPAPGAVQIPEPASWAMVALGAAVLVGRGRLRRRMP